MLDIGKTYRLIEEIDFTTTDGQGKRHNILALCLNDALSHSKEGINKRRMVP